MNVSETRLFRRLQEQAVPDPDVRSLIAVVERIFRECEDRLKSVLRYMPQYTLHDAVHIHRVVDLMGRLIPDRVLSRLQPLEIASLILVAGLHDIGMAPAEDEVRALLELPSDAAEPSIEAVRYRAVRHSHPELLRRQAELRNGGNHNAAGNIEAFFLSEYIRETHAERSRQYVFERHHADLRYRNFAFVHLIADVCFSHTQPIEYLTALPVDQLLGGGEYANFRFIAILLRVADILDFDAERTPQVLFQQLGVRDSVSISEWRKHSAISGWDVRPEYLAYTAQCPDPVIEKSIRDFLEMMEREIRDAGAVLRNSVSVRIPRYAERYGLQLPTFIEKSGVGPIIGPNGPIYTYIDVGFVLDQPSIQALLMGVNLYAQPFLFLREILQNSVDTCRHRAALHGANPELGTYAPQIDIRLFEADNASFLEVSDNGMGMDERIIRTYFARVGVSYYKSPEFVQQLANPEIKFKPVSQFGIGVLSVFMVTEKLMVETRRFVEGASPLTVEIAGKGELFWFKQGQRTQPGTSLRLRVERPLDEILLKPPAPHASQLPSDNTLATRVLTTVSEVAPQVEIPIRILHGEDERWHARTPKPLPQYLAAEHPYLRSIRLDLTRDAPQGLDGTCVISLLQEQGRLATQVPYSGDWYRRHGYIQVIPEPGRRCEHLYHSSGAIMKQTSECKLSPGRGQGVATHHSDTWHVASDGRLCQQGFAVPYPLFTGQTARYGLRIPDPAKVDFQFPIWFDINLSGEFVLALSADRQNVLSTTETKAVCARIAEILLTLFLEALGREEVAASGAFFDYLTLVPGDSLLRSAVQTYLSATGKRS